MGIIKSIWLNIHCLHFKQALRFPIRVSKNTKIVTCKRRSIRFVDGGTLQIGFQDLEWSYNKPSMLNIQGELVLEGPGYHSFAPGLSLYIAKDSVLSIGDNFSCSHNTRIQVFHSVRIGENNMWSYDNVVMDTDSHLILNSLGERINKNEPVVFGDNVWLGCRCLILKGASISDNTVVAAGSRVSKGCPVGGCIIGTDGRIIKQNTTWSRQLAFDGHISNDNS